MPTSASRGAHGDLRGDITPVLVELRARHHLVEQPQRERPPRRRAPGPSSCSAKARPRPSSAVSRSMPPHAGMIPSATWLNAHRTSSAAMRMSHATATSAPPP